MLDRRPRLRPCVIYVVACLIACVVGSVVGSAAAQQPARGGGAIRGMATDSVRGGVLAGAYIELLPLGRQVVTDSVGAFRFDGVPPGDGYRLHVMHAILDTLGLALTTPAFALRPLETRVVDVAVPSAARLVTMLCPPAMLARGPAALVGFVRDPDTGAALDGVTISLVYDDSPISLVRRMVSRVAHPDAAGHYAICGLPARAAGTVRVERGRVTSVDIPVTVDDASPLARRAIGMSAANRLVAVGGDGPTAVRVLRGEGTLRGRIVSRTGAPLAGARVQMDGTAAVSVTGADGGFVLDSVPTGTQSLSVRRLGYGVTSQAVDVVRDESRPVTVVMSDFARLLPPVITTSERDRDLEEIGFTRRRARGVGFFLEGDQLDRNPPTLGESLRMIPGLRIGYDAGNRTEQKAVIMSSRDAKGCVRYVVDGVLWQEISGDIEKLVQPNEIEALEMYTPTNVPGEFSAASRGRCSVLVLWTKQRVRRGQP